jgi:hypothetical protein
VAGSRNDTDAAGMNADDEPKQENDASSTDPHGYTREDLRAADGLLDFFLTIALGVEESESNFGITLSVGGQLVSGNAISRGTWQKLWMQSVRTANADFADAMEPAYDRLMGFYLDHLKEREEGDLPRPPHGYIHLRDAALWQGGTPIEIGLWRGRLDRLDGWSMGVISQR